MIERLDAVFVTSRVFVFFRMYPAAPSFVSVKKRMTRSRCAYVRSWSFDELLLRA